MGSAFPRKVVKSQSESTGRWHNALPVWIIGHDAYPHLKLAKVTLQAIADRCDPPNAAGHLLNAWGGASLIACVGSPSTFWRHVARLEALGFVVMVARIRKHQGKPANVYGIPGTPGGLDRLRKHRNYQRMIHQGAGLYIPLQIDPGVQDSLFDESESDSVKSTRSNVSNRHVQTCQIEALPSPTPSPAPSPSERLRSFIYKKRVEKSQLTDVSVMLDLFDEAVARRMIDGSEYNRLNWIAAALRCSDLGRNPVAMFSSMTSTGQWHHLSNRDDDRARRLINQHLYGIT